MIIFRRTVESRQQEHGDFSAHTYAEQCAAAGKVKNLEESTPYDDSRAYGVSEIEETLSFLSVEKAFYKVGIFANSDHRNCDWIYEFMIQSDYFFFWVPLANPIWERTQRNPMYERCSF